MKTETIKTYTKGGFKYTMKTAKIDPGCVVVRQVTHTVLDGKVHMSRVDKSMPPEELSLVGDEASSVVVYYPPTDDREGYRNIHNGVRLQEEGDDGTCKTHTVIGV